MSEEGKALPDLSEIIGMVSANPKAMAMLSSLLGGAPTEQKAPVKDLEEREEGKETPPRLPPSALGKHPDKNEERRRLLMALKPFLSPERRQAVNTLLLVLEGLSLLSAGKEPPCT
ncbi:MAG: hypothetical protein IJV96_07190 [Clostridia bacterium]|nr:hypothetical protein [Clostridia bacterium]